jgi:hypothetical protein
VIAEKRQHAADVPSNGVADPMSKPANVSSGRKLHDDGLLDDVRTREPRGLIC